MKFYGKIDYRNLISDNSSISLSTLNVNSFLTSIRFYTYHQLAIASAGRLVQIVLLVSVLEKLKLTVENICQIHLYSWFFWQIALITLPFQLDSGIKVKSQLYFINHTGLEFLTINFLVFYSWNFVLSSSKNLRLFYHHFICMK